jgi:hypothetical protein
VSGRAEDLVFKVARREDARQRSGEKIRTVHLGRTRGRDRRDLANSGVRRIKAQVLGVQSREARGREAAKWREDQDRPSGKDAWQRSERSRELGGSQDKGPSIGCSKSRGARTRGGEVARDL